MVRIRLQRSGRKNLPAYRIVVAEKRFKRDGRHIEIIGHYNPLGDKSFMINPERYQYWVDHGAQPTVRVKRLVEEHKK